MSALPPLPLLTYRPDWEERWEAVNARHLAVKAVAFAPGACWLPKTRKVRLVEELRVSGDEMCRLFEAQFRTTDEYRDWRIKWLSNELQWKPALPFEMPSGLPITEVRRRMTAARASWLGTEFRAPRERDFARQVRVHSILSEPPSVAIASLAYALARAGGDRV